MAAHVPGSVLRPIVPILATVGERTVTTYALLDTGANCDAIVPSLVKELGIEIRTEPRNIVVFGEKSKLAACGLADFIVTSFDSDTCISVRGALVSEILTTSNDRPPQNEDIEGLENMEGVVSFRELDDDLIGVILSAKHAKTWTGGEVVYGEPNQTMALKTAFGWTLLGPTSSEETDENVFNCCVVENELSTSLRDDINRMFRHDFLPRPGEETRSEMKHPSIQDKFAMKQIKDTLSFDEASGHYSCGLPWVNGRAAAAKNLDAEASKWNAIDRLKKLGKRLG
jgi:hypothetical protein